MVLITAEVQEKSLILTAPGMDALKVDLISDGEMIDTAIIGKYVRIFERGKASASALQVEIWFVCSAKSL